MQDGVLIPKSIHIQDSCPVNEYVTPDGTIIKYYPDGGIGVIPPVSYPVAEARGREFFRLLGNGAQDSGYATAPDEFGARMRFIAADDPNKTVLVYERQENGNEFTEINRRVYTFEDLQDDNPADA